MEWRRISRPYLPSHTIDLGNLSKSVEPGLCEESIVVDVVTKMSSSVVAATLFGKELGRNLICDGPRRTQSDVLYCYK